jgi:hypothetical protein
MCVCVIIYYIKYFNSAETVGTRAEKPLTSAETDHFWVLFLIKILIGCRNDFRHGFMVFVPKRLATYRTDLFLCHSMQSEIISNHG